jgi:lysophospholipase L1-like esterase
MTKTRAINEKTAGVARGRLALRTKEKAVQPTKRSRLAWLAAIIALGCDDAAPAVAVGSGGTGGEPAAASAGAAGSSGAGGEAAVTCGSIPVEDGFVEVKASDPGIRYVGRLDFTQPDAPIMAFPAVAIETGFEGDAIDLELKESGAGSATTTPYYDVVIDSGPPLKLMACRQQKVYPLARNLAAGTHTVRISKRTEAQVGQATFLGFRVRAGTQLSLPDAPARLLEAVGDSITCGYGDELSTTDPDSYKFTSTNENALLAYTAVSARALGADYVAVAASGRGMVRNYAGGGGLTGPEFYDLTGSDASAVAWTPTRYSPDVIVVNLGTNDFSVGLSADELATMRASYRQTYAEFLAHLRTLHPDATLIAAIGPMMSDSYPTAYQALTSVRSDVQGVVDALATAGDSNVFFLEFSGQSSPYGEDWHPTVATHQKMADVLTPFVKEKKGW